MREIQIDEQGSVTPNPGGQWLFAVDWEHFYLGLEGGWFSGKTFIGARKLTTLHIHNAFNLEDNQPTFVPSANVAPTFSNALDFCVPELETAIKEAGLSYKWKEKGSIVEGKYSAPAIIIPELGMRNDPSVILIRSAERPELITGWQVGAAWGDEPSRWREDRVDPKKDALTQLEGRVRHPKANYVQLIFTYTNEGDNTGVFRLMHSGNKDCALYRAKTKENKVAVQTGFYERQKRRLTKTLAVQYLEGGAVQIRAGKVYPEFNKKTHVKKSVRLAKNKVLHMSVDFNIAPGMHFEIGQLWEKETDDFCFTTVHEIHQPRLSVIEGMRLFNRLIEEEYGGWCFKELQVFGDASGRSEWAGTGESNIRILQNCLDEFGYPYRIRIPKTNPMIVDRLNAVSLTLRDVNGKSHWVCHPRCERLIDDRENLQKDEFGQIEKREKKLSHASDADDYRIEFLKPVRIRRAYKGETRVSVGIDVPQVAHEIIRA